MKSSICKKKRYITFFVISAVIYSIFTFYRSIQVSSLKVHTGLLPASDGEQQNYSHKRSNVRKKLSDRVNHALRECRRMNQADSFHFENLKKQSMPWPWIYVSHKHKLLYCQIPKAGSTNWLNAIAMLDGVIKNNAGDSIHQVPMLLLFHLNSTERKRVMKEYTKFMVAREPFQRVVSAYEDKFLPIQGYSTSIYHYLAQKIIKYYRSSSSDLRQRFPTFEEFLAFVADSEKGFKNIKLQYSEQRHWIPQIDLCYPCNITYDYIIDLDNMDEEAKYMFKKVAISGNVALLPSALVRANVSVHTHNKKIKNYFKNADAKLRTALYRYYEKDYNVFGFSSPPEF